MNEMSRMWHLITVLVTSRLRGHWLRVEVLHSFPRYRHPALLYLLKTSRGPPVTHALLYLLWQNFYDHPSFHFTYTICNPDFPFFFPWFWYRFFFPCNMRNMILLHFFFFLIWFALLIQIVLQWERFFSIWVAYPVFFLKISKHITPLESPDGDADFELQREITMDTDFYNNIY